MRKRNENIPPILSRLKPATCPFALVHFSHHKLAMHRDPDLYFCSFTSLRFSTRDYLGLCTRWCSVLSLQWLGWKEGRKEGRMTRIPLSLLSTRQVYGEIPSRHLLLLPFTQLAIHSNFSFTPSVTVYHFLPQPPVFATPPCHFPIGKGFDFTGKNSIALFLWSKLLGEVGAKFLTICTSPLCKPAWIIANIEYTCQNPFIVVLTMARKYFSHHNNT